MVELREMRHGYRLTAPIEDVKRVLLANIVDCGTGWLRHNNDIFEILQNIGNWAAHTVDNTKYLF